MSTCYNCKQIGHWASKCPESQCHYCGQKGHWASKCALQATYKPAASSITMTEAPVSRTRTIRQSAETLDDILYNNHLVVQANMHVAVDAFVKARKGRVDEDLMEQVKQTAFDHADKGHLKVLGYLIAKYGDVTEQGMKEFLRSLEGRFGSFEEYKAALKTMGLVVVRARGGLHFRIQEGYSTY